MRVFPPSALWSVDVSPGQLVSVTADGSIAMIDEATSQWLPHLFHPAITITTHLYGDIELTESATWRGDLRCPLEQ